MFLKLQNISKSFPGVQALKKINLEFLEGEVHAIVGENGAGKTTLMNIISGVLKPDDGEILLNNKKIEVNNPKQALSFGITMVYQEISLAPTLSVAENIFIDQLPKIRSSFLLDWRKLVDGARKILNFINLNIDPLIKCSKLSIGQQQMIQLARAIARDSKIVILDEPTASLTDYDIKILFDVIKKFKKSNKLVIYISHRLEEIFNVADRVTVLKDGEKICTLNIQDTNKDEIISKMVGRDLKFMFPSRKLNLGDVVLKVQDLNKSGMFIDVNFELRKGEIVGIYGLIGSGRTELALALFGVYRIDSGQIIVNDKKAIITSPQDALNLGIAYLSEDRKDKSIFPSLNVKENITISKLKKLSNLIFINRIKEEKLANEFVNKLKIKISSLDQKVINLSGGNQQKVVVSRLLALAPYILILDEPTRGIDVGAKAEIYSIIEELSENGVTIIFISSDLSEIIGISDRIIVMREGRISGVFTGHQKADEEILLKAASPN